MLVESYTNLAILVWGYSNACVAHFTAKDLKAFAARNPDVSEILQMERISEIPKAAGLGNRLKIKSPAIDARSGHAIGKFVKDLMKVPVDYLEIVVGKMVRSWKFPLISQSLEKHPNYWEFIQAVFSANSEARQRGLHQPEDMFQTTPSSSSEATSLVSQMDSLFNQLMRHASQVQPDGSPTGVQPDSYVDDRAMEEMDVTMDCIQQPRHGAKVEADSQQIGLSEQSVDVVTDMHVSVEIKEESCELQVSVEDDCCSWTGM